MSAKRNTFCKCWWKIKGKQKQGKLNKDGSCISKISGNILFPFSLTCCQAMQFIQRETSHKGCKGYV